MGGVVSCSIGNRYSHTIWVKYDVEKKYVQMEEYRVAAHVGVTEIEVGAGVAGKKQYDWKKLKQNLHQ